MRSSPTLLLHICSGGIGMLSGAVAMSFRKGSRGHGIAGNVFFVSMLSMSAAGTYMAFMKSQINNVFGGVLTFLSRGNSMGDCQAPRREDGHSRLGCASGGIGARYLGRDLRGRGRE
jgi:hypothetical protein